MTTYKRRKIAERACLILNEMLDISPQALHQLILNRVPCDEALFDHPSIQTLANAEGKPTIGLMGILNGIIGVSDEGRPHLFVMVDPKDGHILRFQVAGFEDEDMPLCSTGEHDGEA